MTSKIKACKKSAERAVKERVGDAAPQALGTKMSQIRTTMTMQ